MHDHHPRTISRLLAPTLVAVALLSGLAACSSSDDPASPGTTATSTGSTAATAATDRAGSTDAPATSVIGGPTVPPTVTEPAEDETGLPPTPYEAAGVACVSPGPSAGEPLLVTVTGTLADDPADGTIVIRVLDGDELVDITGAISGGAFAAEGPILQPGGKEIVEAFIETTSGETLDITIAVREHFGDAIEVTTTPGPIAGSGTCPSG